METIINPLWFYHIEVCGSLKNCSIIFAVLAGIMSIVSVILWRYYESQVRSWGDGGTDRLAANAWKWGLKIALTFFSIFIMFALFVPSSVTMSYMLTASLTTTDNINIVYETIMNTARDLIAVF